MWYFWILGTENCKMTRHEYKERYLYIFKMTDKTGSSNIGHHLEHIVIVTDSYSRMNLNYYCNLARKTKFSTTPNSKNCLQDERDIDGQPEIATWPSKPEVPVYISPTVWHITTIPTTNLGFSTSASSQKASTSDYNIERQPEIAIWPPKPEIVISLELWQVGWQFQRKICGFGLRPARRNLPRLLRQRPTTGNRNIDVLLANLAISGSWFLSQSFS